LNAADDEASISGELELTESILERFVGSLGGTAEGADTQKLPCDTTALNSPCPMK